MKILLALVLIAFVALIFVLTRPKKYNIEEWEKQMIEEFRKHGHLPDNKK